MSMAANNKFQITNHVPLAPFGKYTWNTAGMNRYHGPTEKPRSLTHTPMNDLTEPAGTLVGLRGLLAPGGQLVVEDFARREPFFLWVAFEWLLQRIERNNVRTYTLAEAHTLCQQAGLHVANGNVFKVDWLWHGWVIRVYRTVSEAGQART